MLKPSAAVLATVLLVGCNAAPKPAAPAPVADGLPTSTVLTLAPPVQSPPPVAPEAAEVSLDATRARQQYFQILFYELRVQQGDISRNADFWKPFDETFLGLWKHDVLNKNGLRVGRAPLVELKYLREQMAGADETPQSIIGSESKDYEMEVRKDVAKQTIFYADKNGVYEGKDYEQCDNVFAVTFRRAPRHEDRVRITVAPMIRDQKSKMEVVNRQTMQVRQFQPETLYDLGITTELGVDECLVISPNAAALDNATLVGRIFLMENRPAERVEKILVIVPKVQGAVVETTPGTARR